MDTPGCSSKLTVQSDSDETKLLGNAVARARAVTVPLAKEESPVAERRWIPRWVTVAAGGALAVGLVCAAAAPAVARARAVGISTTSKAHKPVITGLVASPAIVTTVDGGSVISASVSNATSCSLSATPALLSGAGGVTCSDGTVSQLVMFPTNSSQKTAQKFKITLTAMGPGGRKAKKVKVKVQPGAGGGSGNGGATLGGVSSLTSDGGGYCALLISGAVDCWGYGSDGDLGNGTFTNSTTPAQVTGVGGTGTLSGVSSLTSDGTDLRGYCALLISGAVDCWGYGSDGELGNGTFYTTGNQGSATPVQVVGVGGTGILGGVSSLTSDEGGYCAVLISGGVDCWGVGGDLGNGMDTSSDVPVQVSNIGGTGTLSGVSSLSGGGGDYCALLTSGTVDCWGSGYFGQLGNGTFYSTGNQGSATPVQVVGVGGSGTLDGVSSLTSGGDSYCALLTTESVDCWGEGGYGELGNAAIYQTGNQGSATPVQVVGVDGGTLGGVSSLTSDHNGYCALLNSGAVDCWGFGLDGQLGNGTFNVISPFPVQVVGVGGTGTLGGVSSLGSNGVSSFTSNESYCAVLTSGAVDCWGYGYDGELGNGTFYTTGNQGSDTPVQVVGVGGSGTLGGGSSLMGSGENYCALLTSQTVDCWGEGGSGALGNGIFYTTSPYGSATPVEVVPS